MTRNWMIFEKVSGLFLILFGITFAFAVFWAEKIDLKYVIENSEYSWRDVSFPQIFIRQHLNLFLMLLSLFSGFKLLKNSRIGWIGSVICLFANAFLFLYITVKIHIVKSIFSEGEVSSWIIVLLIVVFLVLGILLITKEFRKKYNSSKKTWILIFSFIICLLIDGYFYIRI